MLYLFKHSYLVLLLTFLVNHVSLLPQSIYFNHLTTENGLSSNNVLDIIQDRSGFIWLATADGLSRFDGYDFKIFRNDPANQNSLSDNSVWALREDKKGNIWSGTENGWLNCYDPVSDKFRKWKIESDVLKENAITFIYEDSKGLIWIGTYRSGLYRLDPSNNHFDHWQNNLQDKSSISNNYISSALEDKSGRIWISTYNGLNMFDPGAPSKGFKRYFHVPGDPNSISHNILWFLTQSDSDPDLIWVGTANGLTKFQIDEQAFTQIQIPNTDGLQFGNSTGSVIEEITNEGEKIFWIDSYAGLIRLNTNNGEARRFIQNNNDPNSLISNQIHGIIKDKSGVLWIATDKGLSFFSLKNTKFNYLFSKRFNLTNPSQLNKKNIKAISTTPDERIWFGTEEGLYFTQKLNGKIEIRKQNKTNKLNIWSLTCDNNSSLWIGTYGSGLYQLDLKTDKLIAIPNYEKRSTSQAIKYVKSLCADNNGNIWIGFWGMGLARLIPLTGDYTGWLNEKSDSSSLSFDDVWVIHQDKKDRIWIGTDGGGLNLFDESDAGKFYRWSAGENQKNTLSSRGVYSICEATAQKTSDDITVLWIGTNNGLNKFVIKNSTNKIEFLFPPEVEITHYSGEDGLADNSIKCIAEDENRNLWLGTSSGISFFDVNESKFTNFSKADGVVGGNFNFSAAAKTLDGIILMGSTAGLNYFSPEDIRLSSFVPPILITDFQIFNKSVDVGEESNLKSNIILTNEVELAYTQNVFSFGFAALDYASSQSIKYSYMLEGFDKDWVNSGSRRFVTYTNLNPGEYTFKVKATNSDGVWSDSIRELRVIITPPWWQTSWAIGLYALIFILGVWGIIRFQTYRHRLQQELKMQEFEAHHLREVENMKSRFFANLSHEFRTPLTLIKGPLEQLISGRIQPKADEPMAQKDNIVDYYKMILRNTEKLQNLIDQLLELSQLEAETIPLNKQHHELVSLVKGFTYAFIPLAEQKFISLSFNSTVENLSAIIDRDKLEKIINNLLSNAFKFTPESGKIDVGISLENSSEPFNAIIVVSDSGIGIPEEFQSKIFDRFFRIENISEGNETGSGIGLALVKELAELNSWNISVKSRDGQGTIFTLKIPIEKEVLTEGQKAEYAAEESVTKKKAEVVHLEDDEIEKDSVEDSAAGNKPAVLFVEDSPDVRNYVYDLLKPDYQVLLAERAEEGIKLALNHMPDLIISDLMMPGMDGIEFCKKIKSDWQMSHIPFILLTAKVTNESKLEGLETGADDYLTKPFNYDELAARIKNLIEQRKHLREKFSKEINIQPGSLATSKVDDDFLQKVMVVVEKNFNNEKFDTESLAQEMFVSRRQLHRKLQAIAGQGPGEFIRTVRLKRAAQMLIEAKLSVTQIALEVGFESPAQFTRAFKKHFNILPSEFNQQIRNQSMNQQ